MITFEPPRLPDESRELYRFLYDLTEKLNLMVEQTSAEAMWTTTLKALNSPLTGDTIASSEGATSNEQLGAIRQLIIGSADVMLRTADTESLSLSGLYVAKSEFGTYFENARVTINGTPWGIEQLYNYSADIDSIYGAYKQDTEAYIKTGLLYYDGVTPVYGVGVGELYNGTAEYGLTTDATFDPSKTYYEYDGGSYTEYTGDTSGNPSSLGLYEATIFRSTTGHYATFTANDMKFWDGGTELASISASGLNFPNAYILGGEINIGAEDPNNADHYPFHVASDGGLTIGYYSNVLNDYPFKVTASGALTATGATITGTLKAESGSKIGNFEFSDDAIHSSSMTGLNTGTGVWVGTAGVGVRNSSNAYAYLSASDGKLYAKGASISGAITATSLTVNSTTTGTLNCANLTVSNISADALITGTIGSPTGLIKLNGYLTVNDGSTTKGYFGYYSTLYGNSGIGMSGIGSSAGMVVALNNAAKMACGSNGQVTVFSDTVYMKTASGKDIYMSTAAFYPGVSGAFTLGTSGGTWGQIYSTNNTISTSDRNKKHSISYDIDDYETLWDELQPVKYKYNDGTSNRYHIGFISQDIEDAIEDSGFTSLDFAGFIKSPKEEGEGYDYALRYEEFIALNTLKIKKLEARIAALEGAN